MSVSAKIKSSPSKSTKAKPALKSDQPASTSIKPAPTILAPAQIATAAIATAEQKASLKWWKMILLGIFAGMFIALAATGATFGNIVGGGYYLAYRKASQPKAAGATEEPSRPEAIAHSVKPASSKKPNH